MYRHLHLEERGEVVVLRIDRPPANALDPELLEEGSRLVEELEAADPGAVVVTGREGFFSAGVDLKLVPTLDAAGERQLVAGINALFARWYGFARPFVCAVNGHAIAGGLILALCADYRVGPRQGKFGLTELKAAFPYPAAALAVVRAELEPRVARRLALGAELVDPPTALELGLVDELAERPLDRALDVAQGLARLPRSTYVTVKRQLRGDTLERIGAVLGGEDPALDAGLGEEAAEAARTLLSRERRDCGWPSR